MTPLSLGPFLNQTVVLDIPPMSNDAEDRGLVPGTVVAGRLRVVRLLGTGGMGAVYEVEHELTRHRRALKVLHPRVAQSPTIVARFLREASAAARIGNPHIAETFDAGRLESGEPYLLMELLVGETFDGRVQRLGPMDPGDLAELVHQACDGVAAAHDAGIVHRDLKPENLFVTTRDGLAFVKVLDFGISKFDAERTGSMGVTAEGAVMGTPFYMPPEQVRGAASIDLRADVYSLGVILYECVSGVRPYDAPALEQIAILIHEGKARPLGDVRASLPPAFCQIVHRAMNVDREQRYPTARALADALAPFCGASVAGPSVRTSSAPPRVVIRASSAPPAATDAVVAAAATGAAMTRTTATGFADTQHTDPPPKLAGRTRAVPFVAALIVLVAGGVTWTFARSLRPPGPAAAAVPVTPEPEHPAPGSTASVVAPIGTSATTTEDAGALRSGAVVRLVTSSVRPVPSAAGPTVATSVPPVAPPTTSPAAKTRVDQTGLAGENPFR
jgi:eukaryotic-like serine/threonine-protein kinase